ncbi:MAG: hypothetical protein ACE5I1_01175 [bacterium]
MKRKDAAGYSRAARQGGHIPKHDGRVPHKIQARQIENAGRGKHRMTNMDNVPQTRPKPAGLVYDKYYPDPGVYIRIPFGNFEEELSGQLAEPQQVERGSRLDCILQVYEIYQQIPVDQLAAIEANNFDTSQPFWPLVPEKERSLGIKLTPSQKVSAQNHARHVPQQPTRLYRMVLVNDPTTTAETGLNDETSYEAESTAPEYITGNHIQDDSNLPVHSMQ